MELPKFLLADNTDYPTAIFIVHTEFPRFVLNLEWFRERGLVFLHDHTLAFSRA